MADHGERCGHTLRKHLRVMLELSDGSESGRSGPRSRGRSLSADALAVLLRDISRGASLNGAAGRAGVSWRHAWEIVHRAGEILGEALLSTTIGGKGGGGSVLTDTGACVLEELDRIHGSVDAAVCTSERSQDLLYVAATLESVETGLLDAVTTAFRRERGGLIGVVAAGSGAALKLAGSGAVDLALTHAPELEQDLVRAGLIESGLPIMHSQYVIVGPVSDPAEVRAAAARNDAVEAVRRIARTEAPFLSRGDNSGTHIRERALWRAADIVPQAPWYRLASGYGNRAVLSQAAQEDAYALVDQATTRRWPLGDNQAVLYRGGGISGAAIMADRFSLFRVGKGRGPAGGGGYLRAGEFLNWFADRRETLVTTGAVGIDGVPLFSPWRSETADDTDST